MLPADKKVSDQLAPLLQLEQQIKQLAQSAPDTPPTILFHLPQVRAYYVTQELEKFDRELRRTVQLYSYNHSLPLIESVRLALAEGAWQSPEWLADEPKGVSRLGDDSELRKVRSRNYPTAPDTASLAIVGARPGSTDLILQAMGAMVPLLASDPMTAVANAAAWSGPIRVVRGWFRRDPLTRVTGRDLLTIMSEVNGGPSAAFGQPDAQAELAQVTLPDGTLVRGRTITVHTENADGTHNVIQVQ